MTQSSIMWPTSTTGDGASKITDAQWREVLRMLFLADNTLQGVIYNYRNQLAVSGASSPLSVATGGAIDQGFLYWSDAVEQLALPAVSAPTGFRVVLQAIWGTTRTVRLAVIQSNDGVATIPSVTQVDGTRWEVSIASGVVNADGTVATGAVTDTRNYVHFNTKVSTGMLDDAAVTAAKLAAAVAGDGLAGGAGSALSVNVDNTGIEINADTLRLKDLGVVTAKLNDLAVTSAKLGAASVIASKIGVGAIKFESRRGDAPDDWSSGTTSGGGQTNYTLANVSKFHVICQDLQIGAGNASAGTTAEYPAVFTEPPACMVCLVNDDLNEGVFLEARPELGNETVRASVNAFRRDPTSTASPLNLTFMLWVIGE